VGRRSGCSTAGDAIARCVCVADAIHGHLYCVDRLHAARQKAYRERRVQQKVTDRGFQRAAALLTVAATISSTVNSDDISASAVEPRAGTPRSEFGQPDDLDRAFQWSCDFCQRLLPHFLARAVGAQSAAGRGGGD
jgi:hypothetical protein